MSRRVVYLVYSVRRCGALLIFAFLNFSTQKAGRKALTRSLRKSKVMSHRPREKAKARVAKEKEREQQAMMKMNLNVIDDFFFNIATKMKIWNSIYNLEKNRKLFVYQKILKGMFC